MLSVDSYWAVIGMIVCGLVCYVHSYHVFHDDYSSDDMTILFAIITFIGLCFFGMNAGITLQL